jgi:hypothetical protein
VRCRTYRNRRFATVARVRLQSDFARRLAARNLLMAFARLRLAARACGLLVAVGARRVRSQPELFDPNEQPRAPDL